MPLAGFVAPLERGDRNRPPSRGVGRILVDAELGQGERAAQFELDRRAPRGAPVFRFVHDAVRQVADRTDGGAAAGRFGPEHAAQQVVRGFDGGVGPCVAIPAVHLRDHAAADFVGRGREGEEIRSAGVAALVRRDELRPVEASGHKPVEHGGRLTLGDVPGDEARGRGGDIVGLRRIADIEVRALVLSA